MAMKKVIPVVGAVAASVVAATSVSTSADQGTAPCDGADAPASLQPSDVVADVIDAKADEVGASSHTYYYRRLKAKRLTTPVLTPDSSVKVLQKGSVLQKGVILGKDKEPFAKFPDHFKQGGGSPGFSNFSAPSPLDIRTNPAVLKTNPALQKAPVLQRINRLEEGRDGPTGVERIFEEHKPKPPSAS
jgi:hypothetical protein